MSILHKEVLKSIIIDGGLQPSDDVHAYLKGLFKDTLQKMLEAELDLKLGYEKYNREGKVLIIGEMTIQKRKLNLNMVMFQEIEMVNLNQL